MEHCKCCNEYPCYGCECGGECKPEPKPGCTRCLIEFDVDNMITVGDWLLCDDCYEEL